jgi:hypothetical protein
MQKGLNASHLRRTARHDATVAAKTAVVVGDGGAAGSRRRGISAFSGRRPYASSSQPSPTDRATSSLREAQSKRS